MFECFYLFLVYFLLWSASLRQKSNNDYKSKVQIYKIFRNYRIFHYKKQQNLLKL